MFQILKVFYLSKTMFRNISLSNLDLGRCDKLFMFKNSIFIILSNFTLFPENLVELKMPFAASIFTFEVCFIGKVTAFLQSILKETVGLP